MITTDEECPFGDGGIDAAAGWTARLAMIGVIRIKSTWMFGIIYCVMAVFEDDAFTRERDDTFYDKFINIIAVVERVFKDDNFAALRDIRFILELSPSDGEAINDKSVTSIESLFHAWPLDVKAAKNKAVDDQRSDKYADGKDKESENVLKKRVFFEE